MTLRLFTKMILCRYTQRKILNYEMDVGNEVTRSFCSANEQLEESPGTFLHLIHSHVLFQTQYFAFLLVNSTFPQLGDLSEVRHPITPTISSQTERQRLITSFGISAIQPPYHCHLLVFFKFPSGGVYVAEVPPKSRF